MVRKKLKYSKKVIMKKIAFVSSYSESCGNATFTKVLHDSIIEFGSEVQVDVFGLNLHFLQTINKKQRKKGDEHIKSICNDLRSYDGVNIQLESGLYGSLPSDIEKRLRWLFKANPNTSVTLHSPRFINPTAMQSRQSLKKILKLQVISGIKELFEQKISNLVYEMNVRIVKSAIDNNCKLIAHTKRAKIQIEDLFGYSETYVHPLKMVPVSFSPAKTTLDSIKNNLGLLEGDVLIGVFGYISAYKGHLDAFHAMEFLPENYKLLIFGRQHPQTISSNGQVDPYLSLLMNTINGNSKLKNRVFFQGELDDEKFMDVVSFIDVCWLPYYENGQDGSGIASIALELGNLVLCSTSFAFDELFKLESYNNYARFDIGNFIELATKTKMMISSRNTKVYKPLDYSLRSQADLYMKVLGI